MPISSITSRQLALGNESSSACIRLYTSFCGVALLDFYFLPAKATAYNHMAKSRQYIPRDPPLTSLWLCGDDLNESLIVTINA